MPHFCSPAWTHAKEAWWSYWAVQPVDAWQVTEEVTCRLSPSREGREVVLVPGTGLELTAISPCLDPNGACTWQMACSAHMFRVTTGPHSGTTVELWGFANEVKPGVRPVDPDATVLFTVPLER
jgi:hypothetical protein